MDLAPSQLAALVAIADHGTFEAAAWEAAGELGDAGAPRSGMAVNRGSSGSGGTA